MRVEIPFELDGETPGTIIFRLDEFLTGGVPVNDGWYLEMDGTQVPFPFESFNLKRIYMTQENLNNLARVEAQVKNAVGWDGVRPPRGGGDNKFYMEKPSSSFRKMSLMHDLSLDLNNILRDIQLIEEGE